ncbi:MAG: FAD-dependent oxidoreductase, partial [Flavobacteriales bacterium]|nr:FAD-dependent oxidoreductase [Flavobacteriales bacterium]
MSGINGKQDRIVVIGGLSAGPSAAAKARRENEHAHIIMFEKGPDISYATCGIPYALSGVIENRKKLIVVEVDLLRDRFNIDVRTNEEVTSIDTKAKTIITSCGVYNYDKLIYAAGASSNVPPIKNVDAASNWSTCRTLADFDKIMKEGVATGAKHITVLGGGLIGVEVAENLREAGKNVTLIEGGPKILPMWGDKFSYMAKKEMTARGVEVITDTYVSELEIDNGQATHVVISEDKKIKTDMVIVSTGIRPRTQMLIDQGAEHLPNGALKVNERMETSIQDVYAAGDCAAIKNIQTGEHDYFPLGTHSNKGGRAAGSNAAGKVEIFKGAYRTSIVKVFDYTLARTGLGVDYLVKNNIPFKTSLTVAGATPGYYPGQKDLITELYYTPETGKILGAELIGEHGVDKRVDVLSTAIYANLSIDDLPQIDLAYAPPFSPAKDPVVVTGFVADNFNRVENLKEIGVNELSDHIRTTNPESYQLLDVRTSKEFDSGSISGAINIDLHQLRDNL